MADDDRDELMEQAAGEFNPDGDEMGEEELGGGGGGGKKKLIFVLLGLLLLGGGGAGTYFSGILDAEPAENDKVVEEAAPPPAPETYFVDLPDMLVNMDSRGPRPRFLKIRASLELLAGTDRSAINALRPRVIDKFQTYLRELRLDDMKHGEGLFRLREELRLRVSEVISPIEVKDVLFRDILIQ